MANPDFYWVGPFSSRLYVDGGVVVELLQKHRTGARATQCGCIAKGLLGEVAANQEKFEEEGVWRRHHATLGSFWLLGPCLSRYLNLSFPDPMF